MADRQPKLSTPVPIIFILIGSALAIAQISVGAIYLDDCPKQPYIPIYLLVLGVILLVLYLSSFPPCILKREDGTQIPKIIRYTGILVFSFLFCWLIAGSVWIYSIYQPNYTGTDYCNKTLYLFAFWTTTLIYILLGIFLLACFFTFLRKKHQTPLPQV